MEEEKYVPVRRSEYNKEEKDWMKRNKKNCGAQVPKKIGFIFSHIAEVEDGSGPDELTDGIMECLQEPKEWMNDVGFSPESLIESLDDTNWETVRFDDVEDVDAVKDMINEEFDEEIEDYMDGLHTAINEYNQHYFMKCGKMLTQYQNLNLDKLKFEELMEDK